MKLHILSGYKDLQYPYSVGFLVFTLTFQGSEEFLVIIFYIFILLFLFKLGWFSVFLLDASEMIL